MKYPRVSRWRAFMDGAGSLLNLWPAPLPMPPSDAEAIASDWEAVGGDLREALSPPGDGSPR